MICREINDKTIWEGFSLGCAEKTFLHSWNWGEFQSQLGSKIWRFGVFGEAGLLAVALMIKIKSKRGTFLLVPHGPIIKSQIPNSKFQILDILSKKLKEIATSEDCSFIRINPIWERTKENNKVFKDLGFRNAPLQTHPEASWKLDITLSEHQLLANMRKTTRYLIRQATKNHDIQIEQSTNFSDIKIFSNMHEKVSKRQHFVPFSLNYLRNEFSVFQKDNQVVLFLGKYRGELAAASFVLYWSDVVFYHHAVSLSEYAKFSIPYLLQWEAIKEAKRRGCKLYDFWGYVDPKTHPKHPWAGPTLFKMGFGGRAHEYVKTQDLPLCRKYWLTYIFEKIRKIRRGL